MPSPTTAYDLIVDAMKGVGILSAGSGETPTAEEANDGLKTLNDLLERMSLDGLFLYGEVNQTFTLVPGQATRTIGPTGQFVSARPVRVVSAYCTVNGVDFPIDIIGQEEYNCRNLKTQTQDIVEELLYVNTFPDGTLTFWPVPQSAVPLVLTLETPLTQIANLATAINYPPGYVGFMKSTLGVMLAPEYGVVPSQVVADMARTTGAALKRANKPKRVAQFDIAYGSPSVPIWQTGE